MINSDRHIGESERTGETLEVNLRTGWKKSTNLNIVEYGSPGVKNLDY